MLDTRRVRIHIPRTATNVHKWNNPTRDKFVKLANNIRPNFEVSLTEDEVDFGSAGSAHGIDVESNVSDDDAKSQGADSAADTDNFYDVCRKLKEKTTCGVSHKMRPSLDNPEERRPWARLSHGQAEDEIAWDTASLPSHWEPDTASLPSHWEPSRSASRHRRVDRSCGKVRKRFEKRRGKCGQSAEAIRRNFSANAEKVRARLRSENKYAARQHAVAAQHTGLNVHRHVTYTDICKGGMRGKAVIHQDP